jgi:hypothetical protein
MNLDKLKAKAAEIPGVQVLTDVKCRKVWQPDNVHNLHASECRFLLNHEGPHSWEEQR